jgi:GGDEF domain-containing protein
MSALPIPRYEEAFALARGIEGRGGAVRSQFVGRLERSLAEARCGGHRVALFLVGIDRSSGVLSSLEPGASDHLFARVGERLARCAGDDTPAARLRPDQFALVLPRCRGSQVRETASRMLGMARFPFQASIGIAMFPTDCAGPVALIGCAAAALANARREGKHSYCFYLPFFAATSAASSAPDT